jgi:3-hydroxypropanoate dehydrogenase
MTSTLKDTLVLDPEAQALLFREARTVAAFTDEPVGDEVLRTVHDLVQYGPTSMNCSPLRVLALRTDEAKARLLPHMAEGNRAKTAAAPLVLVLAADHRFTEHMPRLFPFVDADQVFADPAVRGATAEYNAARAGVDAEFFPGGRLHASLVMIVGRPTGDAAYPRLPRLAFDEVVTSL